MIKIETNINIGVDKVWQMWTDPEAVVKWNQASEDWYCPRATNDLRVGGKFDYTMSAKDGSNSFEFAGVYRKIEPTKTIEYNLTDGRRVIVGFDELEKEQTKVWEMFEAEKSHTKNQQREGWKAILLSFKRYCEESSRIGSDA
ncbi:MAG: SRPBCC domain-containing protein [Microgenomates group bacterium]